MDRNMSRGGYVFWYLMKNDFLSWKAESQNFDIAKDKLSDMISLSHITKCTLHYVSNAFFLNRNHFCCLEERGFALIVNRIENHKKLCRKWRYHQRNFRFTELWQGGTPSGECSIVILVSRDRKRGLIKLQSPCSPGKLSKQLNGLKLWWIKFIVSGNLMAIHCTRLLALNGIRFEFSSLFRYNWCLKIPKLICNWKWS